jgi:hypothetical protein
MPRAIDDMPKILGILGRLTADELPMENWDVAVARSYEI